MLESFHNIEISLKGRVELKTFIILIMSRILLRIEEGKKNRCDDDGIGNEQHEWQPDQSTSICSLCSSQFSFFKRKQLGFCFVVICSHCRICGRIFCSTCSSHKLMCSDKGKPEVSFKL